MPNHVTNKLVFDASEAARVFAACCPDGEFDFNTLVPQPPHIYRGNLSSEDDEDFKCNWCTWRREHWGTKWNAYDAACKVENGNAIIVFDTAWKPPYPVLSAFANKFGIPFEHRYFDEGHNFWGIEDWGFVDGVLCRTKKRKSVETDRDALCIELKGYDPATQETE